MSPGKKLASTDTLLWSPQTRVEDETSTYSKVDYYIATVIQGIPVSPSRMESNKAATAPDGELQTVIKYIQKQWPYMEVVCHRTSKHEE